ncbi:hypothetical protein [Paractinoplanes rishiriensis]|uniref:Uncharacterized protein n=1 Tax=Paractinoplanes rishiriensis TaxID=1050105 RepID=A0A919K3U5_9ACTN|nr:hypothetical protein [Actinoplanes rishiriensis]GIF00276.1 hypothetical protein Ari01nite_77400 [Actinoplanes rishiriensis]
MNEIELLRRYGPDAPPATDEALAAARAKVLGGMRRRPFLVLRPALAGLGLVALVLGGIVVTSRDGERPPVVGVTPTGPVRLVAAGAPEFPYRLPGLGAVTFTADPGGPLIAVYTAVNVVLTTTDADQARDGFGSATTVDGRPARLGRIGGDAPSVQLTWERRPGEWLVLVGNDRYATEEAVRALAAQVQDRPQRVGVKLFLSLVPDGWRLSGFKSGGTIVTYRNPDRPSDDLSLSRLNAVDPAVGPDVEGFEQVERVTVNGRPARLVRSTGFWLVQATLEDGTAVQLIGPRSLTAEQVVRLAGAARSAG